MNWNNVALNLPQIIGMAMSVAQEIKGAHGKDKEAAVIKGVKTGLSVANEVSGREVINDAVFDDLLSAYIQARVALQNFVTAHSNVGPGGVAEGIILPTGSTGNPPA